MGTWEIKNVRYENNGKEQKTQTNTLKKGKKVWDFLHTNNQTRENKQ